MIANLASFIDYLKTFPNKISRHVGKHGFYAQKVVADAQISNLLTLSSFIQQRRSILKTRRVIQDSQFQMRIERIDSTDTLVIKSSFYDGKDIPFKSNLLMKEIVLYLIKQMIKGNNNYFYTHKNVQYDSTTHELYTNATSNVGLLFVSRKKQIQKKQFSEIFQLLDPAMFQEKDLKLKMHYKLKFRALAVFIISFALEGKLNLFFQMDNYDTYITYQEAKKPVTLLFDRYVQLLSNKRIMKKIQEFQDCDKANYALFLKRVFFDQCKGLTWTEVIDLLIFKYKSVKPHSNIFIDFANQLFQMEQSKAFWEELGLGQPKERQWYLVAKLGIDISSIILFESFEEYIRTEKNWDEDKESVCMTILQLLNQLEEHYNKRTQPKENIEGEAQQIAENEEKPKKESTFTRFSQIYTIVQAAIGYYRAKLNQNQIKYMSNEKRILSKFFNL